jgi:hypothetical protein
MGKVQQKDGEKQGGSPQWLVWEAPAPKSAGCFSGF